MSKHCKITTIADRRGLFISNLAHKTHLLLELPVLEDLLEELVVTEALHQPEPGLWATNKPSTSSFVRAKLADLLQIQF